MSDGIEESTIFGIFHRRAIPEGATPVKDFDLVSYLGRWYEIARMNFYWENENLTNVYAEYSLADEPGSVTVENTGYDEKTEQWETYEGEAIFRGDNTLAALDVSFFGPVYAGYNVIALESGPEDAKGTDKKYLYALVAGRNLDYLWLLSRDRDMPEATKAKFLDIAEKIGYDSSKLNWVDQSRKKD